MDFRFDDDFRTRADTRQQASKVARAASSSEMWITLRAMPRLYR